MKKVWSLEKFVSKEERKASIAETRESLNEMISKNEISSGDVEVINRVLKEEEESLAAGKEYWYSVITFCNYDHFTVQAKKVLSREDKEAIEVLKKELLEENEGKMYSYTPEVRARFRNAHNSYRNSYRVVEGSWDGESPIYKYTFIKVNPGVYNYILATK